MSDSESKTKVKPIILEYTPKEAKKDSGSKSKAKYSKRLEDVQTMEADILRVSQKAAKALSKGIDTYQTEREKSAEEKTDGAIEDFMHNSAKAMSASLKEASDIPVDIADSISSDANRKRLRRTLREASKSLDFWRI